MTLTTTVEFYDGSAWRNISADVIANSLRWTGGFRGGGPKDRVATPGTMDFNLRNGANASGGTGYYSPDHANKRTGWALAAKVRLTLTDGSDTFIFLYRIRSIVPIPGQHGERQVEVSAADYMDEFARRKTSLLNIEFDKRGDELITTLVASMPIAPTATAYANGVFSFATAFHAEADESTSCMQVLQKIAQSELSYVYVKPDASTGEVLTYETHVSRLTNITPALTLTDTMTGLSLEHDNTLVYNNIHAVTFPVTIGSELEFVAEVGEEFKITTDGVTLIMRYVDGETGQRISAKGVFEAHDSGGGSLVSFATASSAPNGAGSDQSTSIRTNSLSAGANTVFAEVDLVAAPGSEAYVQSYKIKGYKVTLYNKIESEAKDQTSIDAYGEQTLSLNMPYQNNKAFGDAVAAEVLGRYKDPRTHVSSVSFNANRTSAFMTAALTLTIGDRITIEETITGVENDYFINGFEYELRANDILNVTWILEPAFNDTQWFTVDHATFGAINGAYLIAPF